LAVVSCSRIAQIDRAISDLDTEAEKEKYVQEFAKKKKDLVRISELRMK
jgi:hypothetical protein